MERLIDYDYIRQKAFADPDSGEATVYLQDIDEAPTVDAVEVVRCKDCQNWDSETGFCEKNSKFDHSGLDWDVFNDDDFCSLGERRTDGS